MILLTTLIRVFSELLCKHTCVFLFACCATTRNSQGLWGHGLRVFLMILCCVTFKQHAVIWQYHSQLSHQQLSLPQNISCGKQSAGETWKGWHGMSVNWMPGRPLPWKTTSSKNLKNLETIGNHFTATNRVKLCFTSTDKKGYFTKQCHFPHIISPQDHALFPKHMQSCLTRC